jgi:hypothetical protein
MEAELETYKKTINLTAACDLYVIFEYYQLPVYIPYHTILTLKYIDSSSILPLPLSLLARIRKELILGIQVVVEEVEEAFV